MSRRYVLGFGLALIVAFILTGSASRATTAGNIDCLVQVSTDANHGVRLYGHLGFMDFPHNPTNVEVDWDDGEWSSTTLTDHNYDVDFTYQYDQGGLRHIKFYVDDSIGDTCDSGYPKVFDVWVQ